MDRYSLHDVEGLRLPSPACAVLLQKEDAGASDSSERMVTVEALERQLCVDSSLLGLSGISIRPNSSHTSLASSSPGKTSGVSSLVPLESIHCSKFSTVGRGGDTSREGGRRAAT